jgi:hypothetical protein
MGLVVFAAMALYLFISIGVVALAVRYARKHGKSAKRWGWGAVLVMYLVPFWDWLPTVSRQGNMKNYVDSYHLNQRFKWVVRQNGPLLFNRWRHEQEVVDTKTNFVSARYVDFG